MRAYRIVDSIDDENRIAEVVKIGAPGERSIENAQFLVIGHGAVGDGRIVLVDGGPIVAQNLAIRGI